MIVEIIYGFLDTVRRRFFNTVFTCSKGTSLHFDIYFRPEKRVLCFGAMRLLPEGKNFKKNFFKENLLSMFQIREKVFDSYAYSFWYFLAL